MNNEQFTSIFKDQVSLCESTLLRKGAEYSTETDRLHNFKVAANIQGETPQQALGGMMAKHIVSIFDLIQGGEEVSMDTWNEKIGDAMNYLFLLKALVVEEQGLYFSNTKLSDNIF
jgi:hypothetical protein